MPAGFSDHQARTAFRDAIRTVEAGSSVEVVVSVRRQSAPWTHAHLILGIAAAIAADAYMLFAPTPFSTTALFVDPILAGLAVGLASTRVLPVKRWLTPRAARRRAVRTAARAAFVERGVRRTAAGTGVLVYVSVVERMAEVVADDGVLKAISEDQIRALADAIDAAVARGGIATARAIAAMAPAFGAALPRTQDEINELPDELHVGEGHP